MLAVARKQNKSCVPKNTGNPTKNKTHIAMSIGPTVKKKNVVKGLP